MVKEFKYKGYSLEEMQKMSIEQLAKIFPSSARRTLLRGVRHDKKVKRGIEEVVAGGIAKKAVKTHNRNILIMPNMVGMKFAVYNGKSFEQVEIKPEMIGFKVGEFIETRKRPVHSKAGIGATKSSKHVGKK